MIQSLGYVVVATPGTPVRATVNQADPAERRPAQTIRFQALPDNSGVVYIGLQGLDTAGTGEGTQVLAILPAPTAESPMVAYEASVHTIPNGLNAADFYVDGSAGEGVIVSVTWN